MERRQGDSRALTVVTTLRVPRDKMDRFREIAALGHRSAAQEMRALIDERIADHDEPEANDDQEMAA